MTARQELGAFGERVAVERLIAGGMAIVATRVRTPSGETDIVARDGLDVAFVEVRTRRAPVPAARETLTPAKLARMWRCAMEYCAREGIPPETARLDMVAIDLNPGGRIASVEHVRGLEVE